MQHVHRAEHAIEVAQQFVEQRFPRRRVLFGQEAIDGGEAMRDAFAHHMIGTCDDEADLERHLEVHRRYAGIASGAVQASPLRSAA